MGTRVRSITDQQGSASLSGLQPGSYKLVVSARGYDVTETRVRLGYRQPENVTLTYRPPLGTFVWNIGPAGEFWDEGTEDGSQRAGHHHLPPAASNPDWRLDRTVERT